MIRYKIKDWQTHFETHESRRIRRLDWVAMPNKHDGLGFRLVAAQRNATDLYAAWMLIVQVASKGDKDRRGALERDGRPLDARDLATMTGFPAKVFEAAFSFFSQPRVQWLLAEDWQDELPLSPGAPSQGPRPALDNYAIQDRTGQDRTGHNKTVGRAAEAAPTDDSEWLAELSQNKAYRSLNVPQEFAKMQAWCSANRKQPTRRRFVNWLNRVEKPMQPTAAYRAPIIEGPKGWRDTLRRLYPENTHEGNFITLPEKIRKEIEAAS